MNKTKQILLSLIAVFGLSIFCANAQTSTQEMKTAQEVLKEAKRELGGESSADKIDWDDRYELALSFIRKNEDDKAMEIFNQCREMAAAANIRALSALWVAHLYEKKDKPNKAILVYISLIEQTDIRLYKVYAHMNLYFLKQRFSSRSFNFQWVPTRMLSQFFLLRASSSPDAFKFYIFNLSPMLMTLSRLMMFSAFWFLCLFMARFEVFQNTRFIDEDKNKRWGFKDILWLYGLFTLAETIVFLPYHGSDFYMNNIERGIYIESILRMIMLAVMSLFFFAVKQVNIRQVFCGTGTFKDYKNLMFRYSGYICIIIGLIGFACRYELFGFERAKRVYEFSAMELLSGTGLYKTILVVIMAPLAEELFYRAIILSALLKFFRPGVSTVLSSLIFAAVHLNPVAFPVIFIMALLLSRAYIVTGGIIVSIAVHFIYNLFSLLDIVRFL